MCPFNTQCNSFIFFFFILSLVLFRGIHLSCGNKKMSVHDGIFKDTWLILPVVICLPQGLSHACLSISIYTVKLRTAHYISNYLFDGTYYMDTRSNSRANTCVKSNYSSGSVGCIY